MTETFPTLDRPRRRVLSDGVYEALKALVMDHRIPPGDRLNIDALARDLDVSPTPVREALARLEADGLVTKRALAGYSVAAPMDDDALGQLFELRLLVEPQAARRAAEAAPPEAVAALAALLDRFPGAGPGEDYESYRLIAQADAAFHDLVARAGGSDLIADTLERLHVHMHVFRVRYRSGIDRPAHAEHVRILRAVKRGDPDSAAAAMTTHIQRTWKRLSPHGGDPLTAARSGPQR